MTGSENDKLIGELSAYLDGELDAQARAAVEALLAESEPARRLLADLRAIAVGLRGLPRAAAPASLAESVIRGIRGRGESETAGAMRASTAPRRPRAQRPRRALRLATGLLATAAAFVIIAVGVRFLVPPPVQAPLTGRMEQAAPPRSDAEASYREPATPAGEPGRGQLAAGEPRTGVARDDASATRARSAPRLPSESMDVVAAPVAPAPAARSEPDGAEATERPLALRANEPVEELTQSVAAGRTVVHVVVRARSEDEYNASVAAIAAATASDEKTSGVAPASPPLVGKALEPAADAYQRTLQVAPPEAWELLASLERVSAGEMTLSVETTGSAAGEELNLPGVAGRPADRPSPDGPAGTEKTVAARSRGGRSDVVGGGAGVAQGGADKEAAERAAPADGMGGGRGGGGGAPGAPSRRAAGADVAGAGEAALGRTGVRDRDSGVPDASDKSPAPPVARGYAGLAEGLRRIWPDWIGALEEGARAAEHWLAARAAANASAARAAPHEWVLHVTVLPPAGEAPPPASQPDSRR